MGEGYRATYEIPFWRMIKYLVLSAFVGFFVGIAFILLDGPARLAALYLANLWVTVPVAFTGFVSFLIWRRDRNQTKRREQQQAQAYLESLKRRAGGDNQR